LTWLSSNGFRGSNPRPRLCDEVKEEENETKWGAPSKRCLVVEDAATKETEILVSWQDPRKTDNPVYLARDQIPWDSLLSCGSARELEAKFESRMAWLALVATSLVVFLIYVIALDANDLSLHGFYRECLARVFVVKGRDGKTKSVHELRLSELDPGKTSEILEPHEMTGPYPIINATLNLRGATQTMLRDRKGAAFVFSPRLIGKI